MNAKLSLTIVEILSVLLFGILGNNGSGVQSLTITSDYLASKYNPSSTVKI